MVSRHGGGSAPDPQATLRALRQIFGSGLLWAAAAIVVVAVLVLVSIRVGRVSGTEVGVILNKMSGEMEVISQSGVRIYNGITQDFYVLDRTIQTVFMSHENGDALKVKTIDGSDVYVDLKVQYSIDPTRADVVLRTSGPGDGYKEKWVWDYIRSISRDHLGALTTEQFYDSGERDKMILAAEAQAKEALLPFGVHIEDIVIPRKPRFYAEYEALIKKKKLADQAVLEEQSKARAAQQRQATLITQETNRMNVAVKEFEGKMRQKVIQAEAEGERVRQTADGAYDRITIGAEAEFIKLQEHAKAILARKKAEAEGIEKLKNALEGPGGRNMVKLEYARRLKGVRISGKPYTTQARTERFEHVGSRGEAAAAADAKPAAE
ncbi:MAG: hypothetical protein ACOCX4_08880 [Planctomycetota bacterium]